MCVCVCTSSTVLVLCHTHRQSLAQCKEYFNKNEQHYAWFQAFFFKKIMKLYMVVVALHYTYQVPKCKTLVTFHEEISGNLGSSRQPPVCELRLDTTICGILSSSTPQDLCNTITHIDTSIYRLNTNTGYVMIMSPEDAYGFC